MADGSTGQDLTAGGGRPIDTGPGRALAPYATQARDSSGRVHPEPGCPMRTPYQRDRDRIVHATAFRRLTYKTQVFVFHEGDHYRTRLTHSLEVAQITRAIARMLDLDEDLAEALALAHDLGHPPFGHAGERALAQAMAPYGGFDHNAQSVKVVTRLERKYAGFDGLNLTLETLEGLAKHNGPLTGHDPGAENVLRRVIAEAGLADRLHLARYAPAEAQAAAVADDIA
jgi:dGTPase